MSMEAQSYELNYELIEKAVHGESGALEKILLHYDAYINGKIYRHIDEDMKVQVLMKLVDAIQKKWRKLI